MTDKLVVVFGGDGFVGRYVTQQLLARGARVRVAGRDPKSAFFLKPLGGLGQTQFVSADITRPATVAAAVEGADAIINLVGILAGDFEAIHVEGAANVARAAADAGAAALVQVSALGADAHAPSVYARTKALGEQAVRAAFPEATLIRPSIIFGPEDNFVNRFAGLIQCSPIVPVIAGQSRSQPVFVNDVAQAVTMAALARENHAGRIYELGGPEVVTMSELNKRIALAIGREPHFVPVPDAVSAVLALMPCAPVTRDQLAMLSQDNVVSPAARTLADFGINATPLSVADNWLVRYRKHGRFSQRASA